MEVKSQGDVSIIETHGACHYNRMSVDIIIKMHLRFQQVSKLPFAPLHSHSGRLTIEFQFSTGNSIESITAPEAPNQEIVC